MRRRDKRKRRGSPVIGLVCTAMIGLCSVIGVSQAYWNDNFQVNATITTGNLNVIFVDSPGECYHKGRPHGNGDDGGHQDHGNGQGNGHEYWGDHVTIADDGKTLELDLDEIKPKDSPIIIDYRVANNGTIPARWDEVVEDLGGIEVSVSHNNGGIIAPNTTAGGQIRIEIQENAQELHLYQFSSELNFRQAP